MPRSPMMPIPWHLQAKQIPTHLKVLSDCHSGQQFFSKLHGSDYASPNSNSIEVKHRVLGEMVAEIMQKNILITGGSGFLGRAVAHCFQSNATVVLGARNNSRNQLVSEQLGCEAVPLDVANIESVRDVVNRYKPDIIIHAAATKFVGLSETQPFECIDVNVLGSQNVLRVAIDSGVSTLVGISTDKAAAPATSTYGMSKAIMERMFCSMDGVNGTQVLCARFGNIAWSTGSVFPLWKRMQSEGKSIESTGSDCRRYFFTVSDAALLVQRVTQNSTELHGKVVSLKMGAAQIRDILDVWTSEFGGEWHQGEARRGDKADEFLIGETEASFASEQMIAGEVHYVLDFKSPAKDPLPGALSTHNAERLTRNEITTLLRAAPSDKDCW